MNLVNKDNQIVLELYINDNKDLFDHLFEFKDEIESKLDMRFQWDRLDNKKASRIKYYIDGLNFEDHSNYDALMDEIIEKCVRMKKVFRDYIS